MRFLFSDRRIIKSSGLFDEKFYLQKNPDVRIADIDPLRHFATIGWKEHRNPSDKFDIVYYLQNNPDVLTTGINPLVHFVRYGKAEGRLPLPVEERVSPLPSQQGDGTKPKLFTVVNFRRSISAIRKYGFKYFFKNAKKHLKLTQEHQYNSNDQNIKIVRVEPTITSGQNASGTQKTYDVKVSFVIPTKNAGDEFALLVKMLMAQKGFRELEIIIVDSGSTDNTIEIAEEFGVKVVKIPPEEFTHSYARNLGAEHATGEYLLFTVQDALPPNDTWLNTLYQVLSENDVVAVSCAETPREDADLFYRQSCWNHYNFLGVNESDRIFSLPSSHDHISLRQNGQLSDLANLISRNVFNHYGFRLNYAEDLDLGIRLIKDGYKLAFLGSTRIIHSHNRPPYYFLKRGFVDNMYLSDVFEDFAIPKVKLESFLPDLSFAFAFLDEVNKVVDSLPDPVTPLQLENTVLGFMDLNATREYPSKMPEVSKSYLDSNTCEFLEKLIKEGGMKNQGKFYDGIMLPAFRGHAQVILNYVTNSYELINEDLKDDIKSSFAKAFSIITGSYLAYCYKTRDGKEKLDMDALHSTLMEGV